MLLKKRTLKLSRNDIGDGDAQTRTNEKIVSTVLIHFIHQLTCKFIMSFFLQMETKNI